MPLGDTPAKLTKDAKAAIQIVFERLGDTERLFEWANQPGNLGVFYTQIWSKIIPKDIKQELSGKDGKNLTIQITRFSDLVEDIEDAEYIPEDEPLEEEHGKE